ncbi:MMPL family transporter [Actinomadura sp. 1N219]|uniref:MMPL family transporter n=1 Tax=Actinomadura sp. 1N219 TaxID=3375152 RepID=UPI00379DC97D
MTVAFIIGSVLLSGGVADRLRNGGTQDPGSASARAAAVLDAEFPSSRPNLVLLVRTPRSVDDPGVSRQASALADRLAREPSIGGVVSYWRTSLPTLRSRDGRQAVVAARIAGDETAASRVIKDVAPRYGGVRGDLDVRIGGSAAVLDDAQKTIAEDLVRAELIAVPITLLVLSFVFGSVVAALLPVGVGIMAIVGANALLRVLTEFTDVSIFAQNLTTVLGLGLAVDYALLIVRRFREETRRGEPPPAAVAATLRTAGRTVAFSAFIVAASLASMLVFPLYFLRSFAYAGIAVVVLAAFATLVPLPALLVLLGRRVDALDIRRLARLPWRGRGAGQARRALGWEPLARLVLRRAPVFAIAAGGVLVLLGLPIAGVEFGMADDRQLPASAESRVVSHDLRERFDGGAGGVIQVVAPRTGARQVPSGFADYARRVSVLPGVLRVDAPTGRYVNGHQTGDLVPAAAQSTARVSYLSVVPSGEGMTPRSLDLVREIRAMDAPAPVLVGGLPAEAVDSQRAIADRLGWAVAMIVGVTLVLVFLMTGSVVLTLQCLVLNALSLAAMFGAVVWVFQDGNLAGVLGFTPTGYVDNALPVLMFCLAFGLSMDYGVFLLSRIKEERDRGADDRAAIVAGIRRTGGVITAAALVLAVVLVAIGTSRVTNTKMLGFGVTLGILIDASVVRCLLLPAVMRLTGPLTWWAPGPLRTLRERLGFGGGASGGASGGAAGKRAPSPAVAAPAGGEPAEPENVS